MIYTNEPANRFTVFLTAYRSYETNEVNEKLTEALAARILHSPGAYGQLVRDNVIGCYQEAGAPKATTERTLMVRCWSEQQVARLANMAMQDYSQDSILQVNSQTRTAILNSKEIVGEYPYCFIRLKEDVLGTFTKQDTGAEHYSIIDGERYEVA